MTKKNCHQNSQSYFKWGATTLDWQTEAQALFKKNKTKESPAQIKRDIEYGSQIQRWSEI